jgi:hypothetical protein
MDLPPDRAEQPFDRRMHVLVRLLDHRRNERREPLLDLGELVGVENPGDGETAGVEPGPLDVVAKELGVGRLDEGPHLGRELALDASCPERHTGTFRARTAASSASSEASRMKPSAASLACGSLPRLLMLLLAFSRESQLVRAPVLRSR